MINEYCILCDLKHNNNYVEIPEENRKGLTCDICYGIWKKEYDWCENCDRAVNLDTEEVHAYADQYGEASEEWACSDCYKKAVRY